MPRAMTEEQADRIISLLEEISRKLNNTDLEGSELPGSPSVSPGTTTPNYGVDVNGKGFVILE